VLGDPAAAGHGAGDLLGRAAPAGDQAPVVLGDPAAAGHGACFLLICAATAGDRAGLVLGDPAAAEHRAPRPVAVSKRLIRFQVIRPGSRRSC
jgi:hypothetical protein